MGRFLFLLIVFIIAGMGAYYGANYKILLTKKPKIIKQIIPSPTPKPQVISENVFVPYWSVPKIEKQLSKYKEIYYFSISANSGGLSNQNIDKYREFNKLNIKNKYLTISMLDKEENDLVLNDQKAQQKIIKQATDEAKFASYSGILLDLEMSPSLNSKTPGQITQFVSNFSRVAKNADLKFYITLYGDNFYRTRPYEVEKLAPLVDKILIMAYDLHKPFGEPGPNFPLDKGEKYPYDIKTLTESLLTIVPAEKLEFIFGMYGYNWVVDENKKPYSSAKSMSYLDIKKSYLDKCGWKNCVIKRDDLSTENEVNYIDENLYYRIVWFEDLISVNKKIDYLKTKNILNFSLWTLGYF